MIKLRTGWMGGLALLTVLLVGGAGCEKKKDGDKAKTEATGSGSAVASAAGSGSATGGAAAGSAAGSAGSGSSAGSAGSGSAAPIADTAGAAGGAESPVIADLHALKDAACACKDAACAEGVQKTFEGFIQKHMNTKPGPGEEKVAEAYAQAMMECLVKSMADAEPPAADPGTATTPPATAGSNE